ncbi:MAG: hypothetical protein IAE79_07610 [Anaerolinea sp.]|nr:hypothetical protein [Anaerolinea sp.]
MSGRYANKRVMVRSGNGRFRKVTAADFGIGGTCPECGHFLLQHYDGDPRQRPIDPRRIRYRCLTCEPKTEQELALEQEIEASRPKRTGLVDMLEAAAKSIESQQE